MAKDHLMKIGEVAKRTGTTLRTVRYYEELDLIRPTVRTQGGFRLYSEEECKRVQLIKNLQLLDFPLAKIKQLFESRSHAETGDAAAQDILAVLAKELKEAEVRIARYVEMKKAIEGTIDILNNCRGCLARPCREVCYACDNITTRPALPLPLECLISWS